MGALFSRDCSQTPTKKPIIDEDDIFRNVPLRYLGYAGHIANSCRSLLPSSIISKANIIPTIYILADVFDKTSKNRDSRDKVFWSALDVFLFHAMATVIIPDLVMNRVKIFSQQIVRSASRRSACGPRRITNILPCVVALIAAGLIVRPIDLGTEFIMENTYRDWLSNRDAAHAHKTQKSDKKY